MRHLFIILILCCAGLYSNAGDCYIPVSIVTDGQQDLKGLDAALRRAFSTDNLTAAAGAQFEVIISPEEVRSEVVTGMRNTIVMVMDIHMTVTNAVTKEQFATTTIRVNGTGRDMSKARMAAARSLRSTDRKVVDFVKESRRSIIDYYDNHLDVILNQVRMSMDLRELDKCMWLLSSVPTCIKRYSEVIGLSSTVFDRYLTLDCSAKLKKAQAAWAASPDIDGARLAISYLAGIDSESSCNQPAMELLDEIRSAVRNLYERDRQVADDIFEFEKELRRADIDNERARIEAMRAIGIAYGENQAENNNIINHLH